MAVKVYAMAIVPEKIVMPITSHQGFTCRLNVDWSSPRGAKQQKTPANSANCAPVGIDVKNCRTRRSWREGAMWDS